MSDSTCTEARRAKMDALWAALGVPLSGCADVRTNGDSIFISQTGEEGSSRQFEVRRMDEGYDVYRTITCTGENVRCGIFDHHLTNDQYSAAMDVYIDILWGDIFSGATVCFYFDRPDGEESFCKLLY